MLALYSSSLLTSGYFGQGEKLAEEESVTGDENHTVKTPAIRHLRQPCRKGSV